MTLLLCASVLPIWEMGIIPSAPLQIGICTGLGDLVIEAESIIEGVELLLQGTRPSTGRSAQDCTKRAVLLGGGTISINPGLKISKSISEAHLCSEAAGTAL